MSNIDEDVATVKTAPGWTPLLNAKRTVNVPAGAIINARFTAQSLCGQGVGPPAAGTCSVRILVNGAEMRPSITTTPFAFDVHGPGAAGGSESHGIERSVTPKGGGGSKTVQVELNVSPQTKFTVSYWHLAVETSAP